MADYEYLETTPITADDKIQQLEDELAKLRGGGGGGTGLMKALENPDNLIKELSLNAKQAKNLRSALIGGGTGAIHNFLSPHIGDTVSSILGAALTSYLARKFINPL